MDAPTPDGIAPSNEVNVTTNRKLGGGTTGSLKKRLKKVIKHKRNK